MDSRGCEHKGCFPTRCLAGGGEREVGVRGGEVSMDGARGVMRGGSRGQL